MANRIFDLKQTTSTFQIRGLVTGVKGKRFYTSGITKNNGTWNAIEFGVLINDKKPVYVKLNGFPRNEVYYYNDYVAAGEKGDFSKRTDVARSLQRLRLIHQYDSNLYGEGYMLYPESSKELGIKNIKKYASLLDRGE